jgi:hypothetical protein
MLGGIAVPVGLFWFAWTNSPSIHWIVSILAGVPFGFGMVLIFLGMMNYLIDAYTIFAASVLAANAVLRSLFGAAFPLFTTQMYHNLGIHWASTIPAFLALICVPMPFLFYKFGPQIREKCKFAAQSAAFMMNLQKQADAANAASSESDEQTVAGSAFTAEDDEKIDAQKVNAERRESEEQEAIDYSFQDETRGEGFAPIRPTQSRPEGTARKTSYEGNPFDLDRVNTRESFKNTGVGRRSRASSRASKTSRK